MTSYDKMKAFLESLSVKVGVDSIETTLHDASFDSDNSIYIYTQYNDLNVMNLDSFAQKVYTKIKYSEKELLGRCHINDLAMSTVDGFIVDKNDEWYFIEFKNQSCSNAKKSVVEKAYQNYFMLMSVFFENKTTTNMPFFNFADPVLFAKKHITYILVVPENKNFADLSKLHGMAIAGLKFRTEYMDKLRHYLFKDAYVCLPSDFERDFVNNFKYA